MCFRDALKQKYWSDINLEHLLILQFDLFSF